MSQTPPVTSNVLSSLCLFYNTHSIVPKIVCVCMCDISLPATEVLTTHFTQVIPKIYACRYPITQKTFSFVCPLSVSSLPNSLRVQPYDKHWPASCALSFLYWILFEATKTYEKFHQETKQRSLSHCVYYFITTIM